MCEDILLYLPTQIRFLIGGERATCHWSKLSNALGRTKLNDALGQRHLELLTRTCMIRSCTLKPRQICEPAIEVGHCFSLEKAFIIQEKGFITAKLNISDKQRDKFDILCLQAVHLTPKHWSPKFGNSLFDRCRQV